MNVCIEVMGQVRSSILERQFVAHHLIHIHDSVADGVEQIDVRDVAKDAESKQLIDGNNSSNEELRGVCSIQTIDAV